MTGFDKLPSLPLVLTRRDQFETAIGPLCSLVATQNISEAANALDDMEKYESAFVLNGRNVLLVNLC